MKKFLTFLTSKGISDADFKAKSPEEMSALYTEFIETVAVESNENKTALETLKSEIQKLPKEAITKEVFDDLKEKVNQLLEGGKKTREVKSLIDEVKEFKTKIKEIAKGKDAEVVLKADTLRSSISNNTQGFELGDIGQLAHRKLTLWDLFNKIPVSESNNQGVIKYWDWDADTTVRAAAAVAEGGTFAESTAKFVQQTLSLQKIGDTLPLSDEFDEDDEMFAKELELFLDTNVNIKIDTDLANGNGTAPNIKGIVASVDAYTPVASGITDANIYDLLVKVSESITTTGGAKYAPNFALMNISDINKMKLKKDDNNNYVIPPFVSRDGKDVGGIVVIESNAITANTLVLGDSRFAKIYYKPGVSLSKFAPGNQFLDDMMTLKVRKRLAFLIRNADKGGFAKVTSISSALTTLAT
jgi:hypothetical protein